MKAAHDLKIMTYFRALQAVGVTLTLEGRSAAVDKPRLHQLCSIQYYFYQLLARDS